MSKISAELRSFGSFLHDCRVEVGKITWPTWKQLVDSVWVVGALILALSLFVLASDRILAWLVTTLTRLGA